MAVVRSVRQSMPCTNLNRMLSLDIVGIGRIRSEAIPDSVCAEEERGQNGIGHWISDSGVAVPETSNEEIGAFIDRMGIPLSGCSLCGYYFTGRSLKAIAVDETA